MSGDGYKRMHESGSTKRKKKEKRDLYISQQMGSMSKFIITQNRSNAGTSTNQIEISNKNQLINIMTDESKIEGNLLGSSPKKTEPNLTTPLNETTSVITESIPDKVKSNLTDLSNLKFSNDPAHWEINADLISYFSENIPIQNVDADLTVSARQFGKKMRYFRKEYFSRALGNGECVNRDWLIYSPSTGSVYCYVCKIFRHLQSSDKLTLVHQFESGFDDWKNINVRMETHEQSNDHFNSIKKMVDLQKCKKIDVELINQYNKEKMYWIQVLRRVIAVIKFLSSRGLAFRGDSEVFGCPKNGNYLGCLELLSNFDPFLEEHIKKFGNPGKGNISYMSSTICNEFIDILATTLNLKIVSEIKESIYFGISIDSTPDIAHIDQLTIIIRYTTIGQGKVVERFLGFVPIEQHDGKYLFNVLTKLLNDNNIDISNCRSQSYDNASNMSGIYSGVQALFREVNKLAEWVPCAAHSLNLVGSVTVECCTEAIKFFSVVQSIYTFLAASPQRWSIMLKNMKESVFVVKSLSETRWSARSDATKALSLNYEEIRQALIDISLSERQPPNAVNEAKSLVKKLNRLETVLMSNIWNDILQQINIVNKSLQTPGIEICTVVNLYNSLILCFKKMRSAEEFDLFEEKAKKRVSGLSDYSEMESRKRKHKVSINDGNAIDAVDQMSARDKFKTQTFYSFRETGMSVNEMLIKQINTKMVTSFPNVNIAFRIYLSIFGTSCEGERSFSILKRVKNWQRSTIGQDKLSSLSVLAIEHELLQDIDTEKKCARHNGYGVSAHHTIYDALSPLQRGKCHVDFSWQCQKLSTINADVAA
ncbi:zinc finger MYM-type protein 1-like [Metopolophium dirhodum]|uniref:zinc finger MYM-type protein 1-like n=1 Tax=Metopolophium dirhodum TaxID=44670 RepID=UPI00298F53C1|nr:zinc finger MYM-type protein 1-like [Metopolophium dirhodum]